MDSLNLKTQKDIEGEFKYLTNKLASLYLTSEERVDIVHRLLDMIHMGDVIFKNKNNMLMISFQLPDEFANDKYEILEILKKEIEAVYNRVMLQCYKHASS